MQLDNVYNHQYFHLDVLIVCIHRPSASLNAPLHVRPDALHHHDRDHDPTDVSIPIISTSYEYKQHADMIMKAIMGNWDVPIARLPHSSPCTESRTMWSHPMRQQSTGRMAPVREHEALSRLLRRDGWHVPLAGEENDACLSISNKLDCNPTMFQLRLKFRCFIEECASNHNADNQLGSLHGSPLSILKW